MTIESKLHARLSELGWRDAESRPLLLALEALGPARITSVDADEVRFQDKSSVAWIWKRGRCLSKERA